MDVFIHVLIGMIVKLYRYYSFCTKFEYEYGGLSFNTLLFNWKALHNHTFKCLICSLLSSDPQYWRNKGKEELNIALGKKENKNTAKNVILFLGDGMSIPTIFGARVYKGQLKGNPGEEEKLVFENFPNVALSKVGSCVRCQSRSLFSLWKLSLAVRDLSLANGLIISQINDVWPSFH